MLRQHKPSISAIKIMKSHPFAKFNQLHGPPCHCQNVPEEVITRYQALLPAPLITHWVEIGVCGYANGLLWLVNPLSVDDLLNVWLEPSWESAVAFARTAFGDIILWHQGRAYYLDVLNGRISALTRNLQILFDYTLLKDSYLAQVIGRERYQKALPRLGPVLHDECYAFVPALALGGSGAASTLQKVKLREHLYLLAQLAGCI